MMIEAELEGTILAPKRIIYFMKHVRQDESKVAYNRNSQILLSIAYAEMSLGYH
jgi:hypothetical protein